MFEAYNITNTTYTTNQPVAFTTTRYMDCRVRLNNNNTIHINTPGCYYVHFNAVGAASAANTEVTIQLYRNGVAVPGVVTTATTVAEANPQTLSMSTIVNVLPSCAAICNNANLQFVVTSADGIITTADVVIFRLK